MPLTLTPRTPGILSATGHTPGAFPPRALHVGDLPWFNVLDYGAVGDGVNDDSAAIQDAIDAAVAVDGTVVFPDPEVYWLLTDTMTIQAPASGAACRCNLLSFSTDPYAFRWGGANSKAVFKSWGWKNSFVENINVRVNTATSIIVWDVDVDATRLSSSHLKFDGCYAYVGTGASNVGWRMGHTAGGSSELSFIDWQGCTVEADTSGTGQIGWVNEHANGLAMSWRQCVGFYLAKQFTNTATSGALTTQGGATMNFDNCGGSTNDVDFEFRTAGAYGIRGGRWELGKKFLVINNGTANISVGIRDVAADSYAPVDGIVFDLAASTYSGGRPVSLTVDDCTFSLTDQTSAFVSWQGAASYYGRVRFRGGAIQSATDPVFTCSSGLTDVDFQNVQRLDSSLRPAAMFNGQTTGMRSLTYGPTVTVDSNLGGYFFLAVTNGTAFTIPTPLNSAPGKRITLDIYNGSGGAMGAVTWGLFWFVTAFVAPANGARKTLSFVYDGTNWVEVALG